MKNIRNKKREIVSKKIVSFTKSYLKKKGVKEYFLGDLIRDFYKERSIKFEVLKEEYKNTITYEKNGVVYGMYFDFYSYNDRCYKLLRDGGLNIIVKDRKRVIILD
jgi:hypothetical protein